METECYETPAERIIRKCGGINQTAEIVGLHRSVVNRWLRSKETGGTGGLVPAQHQQVLLDSALERGIDLSPNDFFLNQGGPREREAVQ